MASPKFGRKPPPPGNGAAPARTELSTIDFGGSLSDASDALQVQEVGPGIGAAFEEAAVLYANGNVREAEAVLDGVLSEGADGAGEGLWMMLLDLYRLTGQKERFESRVLDYATRFERSPPAWEDLSNKASRRPKAEAIPLFNIAGVLSAGVAEQCRQIRVIGERGGSVRLDLKRLRSFDEEGCTLLMELIAHLKAERVKMALINSGHLAEMLAPHVKPGEAKARPVWLLLLELLQHTGEFERFEQVALDYAITFEESPPSWEAVEPIASSELKQIEEEQARSEAGFVFEGELLNAGGDTLRKLAAAASERDAMEVDCTELRRMDFVTAGTLFNIVATLRSQGKLVTLVNVNAMVGALLRVMGVDQVAQVTLRG